MRKVSLFHLLAKSPLLGFNIFTCYWVAFVVLFPTKVVSCHSDFICKRYGFPVFNKRFLPLIIWFYHILLKNDVSLHNLVVLVVTIPTSPSLPKTEFVCGRYCVFGIGSFLDRISKGKRKKGGAAGLTTGLGRLPGRPVRAPPRPPCRPRPGHWPDRSGGPPASLPAWAGSQAGPLGWHPGSPAGLGRLPGRPARWLCCLPLFFFQRLHFWSPYLRGFFPKNKLTFCQPLELFSPSIVDLLKLGFLSISPIVLASF